MQTGNKPLGPEDASDPESKWWWALGHATPWLASLIWVGITLSSVFHWSLFGLVITVALLVMVGTQVRHDFQPVCIRCMREQPENGGQVAQRKLVHLWAHHLPTLGPLGRILLIFVVLAGWIAGNMMIGTFVGTALMLVSGALISYDWYLVYTHRKLKPWCPWCKDPGDDPDPVPERDPDPSMTKRG